MVGIEHDRSQGDADIVGKWDVIVSRGGEVGGGGRARPSRSTSSTPLHRMPGAGLLRGKGAIEVEGNGVNGVDMSVCRGCRFIHVLNDHVLMKVCEMASDQSGGSWKRIEEGRNGDDKRTQHTGSGVGQSAPVLRQDAGSKEGRAAVRLGDELQSGAFFKEGGVVLLYAE